MARALSVALLILGLFVSTGIGQGQTNAVTSTGAKVALIDLTVPALKAPANTLKLEFNLLVASNDITNEVLNGVSVWAQMNAFKNGPWPYTAPDGTVKQVQTQTDNDRKVQTFGDYRNSLPYLISENTTVLDVASEVNIVNDACAKIAEYLKDDTYWGSKEPRSKLRGIRSLKAVDPHVASEYTSLER